MDPPGPLERRATQAFYYVTPPDARNTSQALDQGKSRLGRQMFCGFEAEGEIEGPVEAKRLREIALQK
jgi:hypothetical protein